MIAYDCPARGEVVRITEEAAIAHQRAAGLQRGHRYLSDAEALEDFLTVHWAWAEPA